MARVQLNADAVRFRRFCREYLRFVEGSVAGQPVEFEPWLLDKVNSILSRNAVGRRRFSYAYLGLAKKNNKSTFGAALALYFLVVESAHSADGGMQVYAIAASKDQAKIVFGHAKAMVEASPLLSDYLTVFRDSIVNPHTGARFEVLSADAPKTHGKNPSIVICDELHAHESGELHDALLTAMIARDEPLFITLTNAGSNEKGDSICAQVYRRGKEGSDPSMFFWSPTIADDELDRPELWKRVNPSSWITVEKLLAMQRKMPPYRFERFHLNRWTRADRSWLPRGSWEGCPVGAPAPPERVVLGLDMSRNRDTTALAIVAPRGDGRFASTGEVWAAFRDDMDAPPDAHHVIEGGLIPFEQVFARIRELCRQYDVVEIAYDPYRIPDDTAERLEAEGLPMTKFPQTDTLMVPASAGLFSAITEGRLSHEADDVLDSHVAAASAKDVATRNAWRLSKDAAKSPSDYTFALAMAVARASQYEPATDDDFAVRYG